MLLTNTPHTAQPYTVSLIALHRAFGGGDSTMNEKHIDPIPENFSSLEEF